MRALIFIVVAVLSTNGHTDTIAGLDSDADKAAYCFYTKSLQLQYQAADSSNPAQALSALQTVQTWQGVLNALLPDRDIRNQHMATALQAYNQQAQETDGQPETLLQQVIVPAMPACAALMARSDLAVPPPAESEETPAPTPPAAIAQKPDTSFKGRPADSPFEKEVFAPGWRGDLLWTDVSPPQRVTLMSFDHIPPGKGSPAIHFNVRTAGSRARELCVGHLVEANSSPDGKTLFAFPAEGNDCGTARRVRITALSKDRLRMEVEDDGVTVASGELSAVSHAAWLPRMESVPAPAPTAPLSQVAQRPAAEDKAKGTNPKTEVAAETVQPAKATPQPAPVQRSCATCLPTEPADSATTDLFAGLFDDGLKGNFPWDWHDTDYFTERTKGTLTRTSPDEFTLVFDSKIPQLCVGGLVETGRSSGGFVIHLQVKPGEGTACKPRITHGYLYPYLTNDGTGNDGLVIVRMFDAEDRLITNALLRSETLQGRSFDMQKAYAVQQAMLDMEKQAKKVIQNRRMSAFENNPDYARLGPFYDSCMRSAPNIFGVMEPRPYCVCMANKFGVGERIPEAEFASYVNDFSLLVARFSGAHTKENRLYTRLAETCRSCSLSGREIEPYCTERDRLLYVANDYASMIRLLDKDEPIVEATDYYKKYFFRVYLQGFSQFCREDVVNPVQFDFIVKEFKIGDPWADPNGEVVQHDTTFVTARYAPRYKQFREDMDTAEPGDLVRVMEENLITNEAQLRRRISDVQTMLQVEYENRMAIRSHLEGQCGTRSVRRVYANLDGLVR